LQKQLGELKEFEDVTQEALSQYVTQRRLIDIDIAATRARLDACQKILSGRADLAPNKISQLEGLKTVAEVELVGYAAKRAALESIIRDGRQYLSRQNEIKLLTQRLKQQTSDIANIEATLAYLKAALEPKTYFGEVVSYDQRGWPHVNEVLIGGVRWQEKRGLDLLPFPGMPGLGDAGTGAVPIPGMPGFGGAGSGAVPMGEMPGASKSGWGSSAAGAMPKGPFPKAKPEPGAKLQASPSPK
jgi:hypothetical protein